MIKNWKSSFFKSLKVIALITNYNEIWIKYSKNSKRKFLFLVLSKVILMVLAADLSNRIKRDFKDPLIFRHRKFSLYTDLAMCQYTLDYYKIKFRIFPSQWFKIRRVYIMLKTLVILFFLSIFWNPTEVKIESKQLWVQISNQTLWF